MAQYLAPGVYVEEIAGPRPIESVGTATGAFVGIAERGPIGQPMLVTNWTQYVETFGGFIANGYLPYAVRNFFDEGGSRCYVVRTCHYDTVTDPTTAQASTARVVLLDRAAAPQNTLAIEATSAGSWGDNLAVLVEDAPDDAFHLTVLYQGVAIEPRYSDLTMDDVVARINGTSKHVRVTDLASPTTGADRRPAVSASAFNDLEITALAAGLAARIDAGTDASSFKLILSQAASDVETHDNLTMENIARRINGVSNLIQVNVVSDRTAPDVPTVATALPFFNASGGWDGLKGKRLQDRASTSSDTLEVSAWRPGVSIDIGAASTDPANRFKLTVRLGGNVEEVFDDLTMATVESEVNDGSALIEVDLVASGTPAPDNRPELTTTSEAVPFGLDDGDFLGDEAAKNGLHAFDEVDDINIVAIPDRPGDRETVLGALTYCQNRGDCFFIADPLVALTPQEMLSFKQGTGEFAGNAFNSSYGALYYPWILVNDLRTGGTRMVPPSGAVMGTYSATDVTRGVHKAPAGTTDGYLNSAVGIERLVTRGESELLNPNQINAIRSFPTSGIVVWGARTLSSDAQWKYVNVRRLLLYIEESIEEGTQWVVFEPNDRALWARVKREVTAFLAVVWQSGALFGATAEEAFFVKIDDENNPPESRDLGRLVVDVGVAPVKPAEFVVFRLTQKVAAAAA